MHVGGLDWQDSAPFLSSNHDIGHLLFLGHSNLCFPYIHIGFFHFATFTFHVGLQLGIIFMCEIKSNGLSDLSLTWSNGTDQTKSDDLKAATFRISLSKQFLPQKSFKVEKFALWKFSVEKKQGTKNNHLCFPLPPQKKLIRVESFNSFSLNSVIHYHVHDFFFGANHRLHQNEKLDFASIHHAGAVIGHCDRHFQNPFKPLTEPLSLKDSVGKDVLCCMAPMASTSSSGSTSSSTRLSWVVILMAV